MTTTRSHAVALLLQIAAGSTLLLACFQLFANWLDATVAFLGETATVEPSHVRAYLLWLGVGVASLVVLAVAAGVRRGTRVVPVLLGTVLAASALLCHVSVAGADPAPSVPTGNPNACYSGSNDCPGG